MTTVKLPTFHSGSSPNHEVLPRVAEQESPVNNHARHQDHEVDTVPDTRGPKVIPSKSQDIKEKTIPSVKQRGLDTDVVLEPVSPRPYDLSPILLMDLRSSYLA